ncbi:hypothetical protein [Bremerella sp. P1]|uniref:hypothetical protein n=1 Tax=Bremerella sp. P1 TaxID=3026424 RepID=UPI002367CE93|nr:hypothetical protein [Bremerella sp. P1]WDI44750.1 hypothetical protein PSR63_12470 [Bremerella sp. P1]
MPSKFNPGTYRATVNSRVFTKNNFGDDVLEIVCKPTAQLLAGGIETPIEGNNLAWVQIPLWKAVQENGKWVTKEGTSSDFFEPSMKALGVPEGQYASADTCSEFASEIVIYNKPNTNGDKSYDNWRLSLPRGEGKKQAEPPKTDPTVKAKLQMALGGKPAAAQPATASAAADEDCPF